MKRLERCEEPFLIIVGAIKAGTTSLHQYLADHPGICGSQPKGPSYFLPLNFQYEQVECVYRHGRDALSDYLSIFRNYQPGQIRMEASPNYLPVPGTPEIIRDILPNTRIVISLRDPIARLISYYQMSTLFRWLPTELTFDEYIKEARRVAGVKDASPHYKYPMNDGLYSDHVRRWQEVFGKDRVLVTWFDELKTSPVSVVSKIVAFAGLDPDFYEQYNFSNVNPARAVRNESALDMYHSLKRYLRSRLKEGSLLRRMLAAINRGVEWRILYKILTQRTKIPVVHPDTLVFLKEFYRDDVMALEFLVSEPVPWAARYLKHLLK